VWAIGQALAATEILDLLLDPKRSHDGLFPELVVFDCHACHHSMRDVRWTPRTHTSPGRIRLNDASFLMLRQIAARAATPEQSLELAQQVAQLQRAVAGDGGDALEAARALRGSIDALVANLARRSFTAADLRAMMAGLVEEGVAGQYRDYAGAEQATMAIASLANYLARRGELADVRGVNAALDKVYETVKDDETYRPERYQAALAALGARVGATQ
jgi:hypothetical protein